MEIQVICGYRSKSEDWDEKWKPVDWRARNLVKALKRLPFNGFAEFGLKKGRLRIDNTESGQRNALEFSAANIVLNLRALGVENAQIVPIPSSSHTEPGSEFTGSRLSEQIERYDPSYASRPVLFFNQAMPKSATGGGRNELAIYKQIRQSEALDDRPVVVIDDVYTSGAHFRAVARHLKTINISPEYGHVVGRTVWERPAKMFDMPPETIG